MSDFGHEHGVSFIGGRQINFDVIPKDSELLEDGALVARNGDRLAISSDVTQKPVLYDVEARRHMSEHYAAITDFLDYEGETERTPVNHRFTGNVIALGGTALSAEGIVALANGKLAGLVPLIFGGAAVVIGWQERRTPDGTN